MSTSFGGPEESLGAPGNLWPSEPITLEPGESGQQVVLRKIRELSETVWREQAAMGGVRQGSFFGS
jgi:hypothetical protein